ncbi:hypothetical protein BS50DRAFT_577323 [Corynespora cassiicola Philippines]|uniref:Uncharacterized protein n=1 Tax=Corynespora cassiicola Philippines TaxID=1448308 RepID=A0A2T2NAD6_CORCC|nr:hypothetical protein BS50DRAFT_577323 [Corynespora cassiicola Philippines]
MVVGAALLPAGVWGTESGERPSTYKLERSPVTSCLRKPTPQPTGYKTSGESWQEKSAVVQKPPSSAPTWAMLAFKSAPPHPYWIEFAFD